MSQVRHIDAAGIDVLLQCMREAVKHDGDLKLAALSPQAAVVLELTRTGRLFEIYENVDRRGEELQLLPAQRHSSILTRLQRRGSRRCWRLSASDGHEDDEREGAGLAA